MQNHQLPPSVVALVVAAFAKAGELTAPLATTVAQQFCATLKDATRQGVASLFPEDTHSPHENFPAAARRTDTSVDFSSVATVLVAMKESGLLDHSCAGHAARALQHELLLCMQSQWGSLGFSQLRRAFLLLGATAGSLGLQKATARELLTAAKKHLRKMHKKHLAEDGDARDSLALLWPLATISAALALPLPQSSTTSSANPSGNNRSCSEHGGASCSSREELEVLLQDRDIVLHLLKAGVLSALSSRLPCSPFDLALVRQGRFHRPCC